MYYQCELSNNTRKDTVWLEEKYAIKDKKVKLLDSEDPKAYWKVEKVYQIGLTHDNFKRMQELHRKWHNNI